MAAQNNLNLRKYHTIFLEIGLIASLLIFIIAMKADFPGKKKTIDFSTEDEVVTIQQIPRTEVKKQQPAPADPVLKANVPIDDPIIDYPNIDINVDPIEKLTQNPPVKIESQPTEEIFVAVEQEPEIIGGKKSLYDKLKYPAQCRRAGIEGRVTLRFVVNIDGSVQDIEVVRGIGGGCDDAAVRALKDVTFKPGRQRGEPVRVRFSWPITFQLN